MTYPDVKYICCDTVAAEGALEIFAEKKITGIGLLGGYSTPVIEDRIKEGDVLAMASGRSSRLGAHVDRHGGPDFGGPRHRA